MADTPKQPQELERRIGDLTCEQWQVWAKAQASVVRIEEIDRHVQRLLTLIAAAFSSAPTVEPAAPGSGEGRELREAAEAWRLAKDMRCPPCDLGVEQDECCCTYIQEQMDKAEEALRAALTPPPVDQAPR